MDSVLALWPYLLYLLPVAAGGAVWAMRRSFASTERVERLENRMTEMETRYASIPGTEDVHEMRLRIAELSGDIRVLSQRVQSFSHQLELLLENAVNRSNS
ncbi:DUF2730 family protein [Salmonella enterica]|jgi:hypothetical protein|uniref:DUF2730 family protein n=3 Tax=root TaxID=1 RepID=A0A0C4UQY8_9CAUD|nr:MULTISPECIES: DUF2730 family protein [Enterobacteriaceae]YP_009152211.1 DUF2730 family protein [Shigella phage SfMu]EAO7539993.1 DUF2730 family protein [Salmonella enterica]EBB9988100.1 DUF2730 family protein [Salmonella enterica subsp. enterica serovar Montevideo]EBO1177738.1 DUF2730 family protein [Salmonella enterica subsp. enterica serovar Cerro]EBO2418087.1 DUF2730 family protein [Salmonella enterica subsp. enterica serovar Muenster]EBZ3562203.1 DUF2730 family protein [Salmonella ente